MGKRISFAARSDHINHSRSRAVLCIIQVGTDATLQHLERTLFENRLAIILFLVGIMIFAYTLLNAPVFQG